MLVESRESLHDTAGGLADEIASEILIHGGTEQTVLREELNRVRRDTARERNPNVAYTNILFRKFASLQYKELEGDNQSPGSIAWGIEWLSNDTSSWVLRAVTAAFALITFAVMSSAPYISSRAFHPNEHFHRACMFKDKFEGSFNFRPYHVVIAVGVIGFALNCAYILTRRLPRDAQGRRFLPGFYFEGARGTLVSMLGNSDRADYLVERCGQLWEDHGAFIRMTLDAAVLLLGVAALLAGAATLQKVERAVVYIEGRNPQQRVQLSVEEFYTLTTCYLTYSKKTPVCLDKGLNPAPKITASLVMLFLTCLCMVLCTVVSWRECSLQDSEHLFARLWGGPQSLPGDSVRGGSRRLPAQDSGELQSFVIRENDHTPPGRVSNPLVAPETRTEPGVEGGGGGGGETAEERGSSSVGAGDQEDYVDL